MHRKGQNVKDSICKGMDEWKTVEMDKDMGKGIVKSAWKIIILHFRELYIQI